MMSTNDQDPNITFISNMEILQKSLPDIFPNDLKKEKYKTILEIIQKKQNLKFQVIFNWIEKYAMFNKYYDKCNTTDHIISVTEKTPTYNILDENNKVLLNVNYTELQVLLTLIEYLRLSKEEMFT